MRDDAVVIVGCGRIARRHAAAGRRLGIPLIFASRDLARARAYAKAFRGVAAFGSYAEAFGDPRASGAIICTPHDRHVDDGLAALSAGKHVLVEKPIACTLEDADRMIAAAADSGRALMVAENFHFMPAFRHVRAGLRADAIGALRELHLVGRGFRLHAGWRLTERAMGGGTLIDGGIHHVHNLRTWGGPVRSVFALRPPQTLGAMTGEDAVSILAELEGGVVGFVASSLAASGVPRLQWSTITGTEGTCFIDNRGGFVLVRGRGRIRVRLFRRDRRGHDVMLAAFREAMADGKVGEMDGAAGRGDLAVVLAAYRSIVERRPVEVGC